MTMPVTLTGAVDDNRGLTVTIYQDHDGVRIDTGGIEIMLGAAAAADLAALLETARTDAILYEISQPQEEE